MQTDCGSEFTITADAEFKSEFVDGRGLKIRRSACL